MGGITANEGARICVPGAAYEIVPYDPEHHMLWVTSTFLTATATSAVPRERRALELSRHLRAAETFVARVDDDQTLIAWLCRYSPTDVVFGYTKYALRRMGIMSALSGVTRDTPTGVRYWTHATMRMVRDHRYRLYLQVPE